MTSEVMGGRRKATYGCPCDATVTTFEQATQALAPAGGRPSQVGKLLRSWRERRRLTQLDLALAADVSTRHISYVETGRSKPTSAMILHLSDQLEIPLRERNVLLLAGGYAPAYPEHGLNSPPMSVVNDAINSVLEGHLPYPAVVVDRHWELVAGNAAMGVLTEGSAEHLLEPPINALRLSLHPDGMASRIMNLGQWRDHILHRLAHQAQAAGDDWLRELHDELAAYPAGSHEARNTGARNKGEAAAIVVPLRYRTPHGELSFFSTTTVFGTPLDVTVAELAIEAFYPAEAGTAEILTRLAG
jgi:transcriptional regulator with XRE-family HTH domain